MNKIFTTFFTLSLCQFAVFQTVNAECSAYSNECVNSECPSNSCFNLKGLSLELGGSAFFPLESIVRDVYGTALPSVDFEATFNVFERTQAWLDISYVSGSGHSLELRNKTNLHMVPISLGARYFFPILCCLDAYVGLGVSYSWLKIHIDSPHFFRNTYKNSVGALVKTGLNYYYGENVFFDVFFDYLYQQFHNKHRIDPEKVVYRHHIDMSALKLGVGVGYSF